MRPKSALVVVGEEDHFVRVDVTGRDEIYRFICRNCGSIVFGGGNTEKVYFVTAVTFETASTATRQQIHSQGTSLRSIVTKRSVTDAAPSVRVRTHSEE